MAMYGSGILLSQLHGGGELVRFERGFQNLDSPLKFQPQSTEIGVLQGDYRQPCLSEGVAAAIYSVLSCEP